MNRIIPFLWLFLLVFSCKEQKSELDATIRLFDDSEISSAQLTNFFNQQMDSLEIPGLSIAIINDAEVVYSENIGYAKLDTEKELTEHSIFEAASLSKPVFAYMIMKLSERGAIVLTRPLHFYLPDSLMEVDQRYKNVNAMHVLSHSTGFPNWRWHDKAPDSINVKRGTFYMLQNPGDGFTYSGEGYDYLARVIASNTEHKMSELDNLFEELVQKPLGIEHMYFTWDEYLYEHKVYGHIDGKVNNRNWGSGLPYQNSYKFSPSGGLHTNAENYAKFLIAMMNGKGLLPETYKEMLTPRTVVQRSHNRYKEDGNTHWSLGFAITPLKNDTLYNHGGTHSDFQSQMAFSKNSKFGYVFFVNTKKGDELNKTLKEFLRIDHN
ncbi:MAG: serine hydrolase domain-containing protein [Bacteroidota bacterium]